RQGACKTVNLIYNCYIYMSLTDISQQALQTRTFHRRARQPTVVVAGFDDAPALAVLTADVGLAGLALRLERVEVLLEPFLGGFAGVDGAAPKSGLSAVHALPEARRRRGPTSD